MNMNTEFESELQINLLSKSTRFEITIKTNSENDPHIFYILVFAYNYYLKIRIPNGLKY